MTHHFPLGQVVATPGAIDLLDTNARSFLDYLARHHAGDWGDIDEDDAKQNDLALNKEHPQRILSVYKVTEQDTLWVITEWDRSLTTLLLPQEY